MVAVNTLLWAAAGLAVAVSASSDVITNDTYFYGESPPVYPSRTSLSLNGEENISWMGEADSL